MGRYSCSKNLSIGHGLACWYLMVLSLDIYKKLASSNSFKHRNIYQMQHMSNIVQ